VDGKTLSPCDVEKLQKCLAENHGDRKKVRAGGPRPARAVGAAAGAHCDRLLRGPCAAATSPHWARPGTGRRPHPSAAAAQCEAEVLAFKEACGKAAEAPAAAAASEH
jgi:hypothetical protein